MRQNLLSNMNVSWLYKNQQVHIKSEKLFPNCWDMKSELIKLTSTPSQN